jgi:hypothetical protein
MAPPLPNSAHETSSYLRNLAVPRVFKRPSYVTRWRRTGWLGRRDSNLRAVFERPSYLTRLRRTDWLGRRQPH